ncbi:MAG: tetratricopeptide repeat protein [Bryobacteraceae bacterium]
MWFAAAALLLMLQADPQEEGLKALDAKNYPAAIASFEKALTADPKDYSAQFHLGLAQSLAGDNAKAAAAFRKTLELKPGLYEAQLNLGVVLINLKQSQEAEAMLRAAVEQKPKEFRPVYYLAEANLAAGKADEAERGFRAALELDPKSVPSQAGLGRALTAQGKLTEAEAALRQAGDADGLLELAARLEKAKQLDAAIGIYKDLAAQPGAGERLGELMLEAGKPGEAIPYLEAAVKQSATAANRYALATAYLRDKQPEKATKMMEQAIASDPNNAELRMAYGGLMRDQRNFQAAAQQYWGATKLKPESKEAWSALATMLLSLENYPQAIAAFDKLESLGDPNPGIYFLRAMAFDKTKQYKPAKEAYEKFLSMSQSKFPEEEFKARQRLRVIEKELSRR